MKTVRDIVRELEALVEYDEALYDTPVYVIADHGQTFIESNCVSLEYVEGDLEYSMEGVIDLEEAGDLSDVKAFVCIGD